uniref:Mos1 transposase HTH domain-containing protein n=1 Tax=Photinus pyralis TaxID=7054 RepID=A0A1Y1KB00_PHOPY
MNSAKEEQQGLVRFFTAEGVSQHEISRRMTAVYDELCITLVTMKGWCKRFTGRKSRGQSYCGSNHNTQIDELIEQECRISLTKLAKCENISDDSVHTIMHDPLVC